MTQADARTPRSTVVGVADDDPLPFPCQTIRERDYELIIYWGAQPEDPENMNVDIEVSRGDRRYSATVFTLRNVATLLRRWRATGEEPNAYFRVSDAVLVDAPITERLLRRIVEDSIAAYDLGDLERLDDADAGSQDA